MAKSKPSKGVALKGMETVQPYLIELIPGRAAIHSQIPAIECHDTKAGCRLLVYHRGNWITYPMQCKGKNHTTELPSDLIRLFKELENNYQKTLLESN